MATSRLCSIPDCGKRHSGRGYCGAHYERWKRYGDPLAGRPPNLSAIPDQCTVTGCGRPHDRRGYCSRHYYRFIRHGTPHGGGTSPGAPLQWLQDHVDHDGDGCLTWPFARIPQGGVVQFEGKQTTAASVMCLFAYGPKPTPLHEAAHNCGKAHEACVNPKHLRWDTRSGNHMDKHRHNTMPIGERCQKHILTTARVLEIRNRTETPRAMAKRYGVTVGAIYAVLKRRNWKWLD